MSTLTTAQAARLPRVNLLPGEIAEARRLKVVQGVLGGVVLAVVVVIGLFYVSAVAATSSAEEELAAAQDRHVKLQRDAAKYAEVPKVAAEVAKAETQLASAMAPEVRWSYVLNDVGTRIPRAVSVKSIEITQSVDAPVAPAVSGVDTGGAVIAKIAISGEAPTPGRHGSHNSVADWLDSLTGQANYANSYFTDSKRDVDSKNKRIVKFESTVDVNDKALSRRFTPEKSK